jgi:nanoRNase/pAp phosphatase (c-di-AMP/oligoRNAs hydrolase)
MAARRKKTTNVEKSPSNKAAEKDLDENPSDNQIVFEKEFKNVFSELNSAKQKVAIFTHDTPDPDAMGSARGLQWLLMKVFKIQSDIFYSGDISHPQNKTMVNILDLRLSKIEEYNHDDYEKRIIVDCTESNSPCIEDLDIVLDHHRATSTIPLSQISPVGSTCTLIYELIRFFDIGFEDELDQDVATALFTGIRTDTQELISENTTDRDFEAFKSLSHDINRKKLASIINYPIPSYFFDMEKELNKIDQDGEHVNQKTDGSCFVGCIGVTTSNRRDAIPMLADKTVRMEGIETTVIFGIVGNNVVASIRSHNTSLDVNSFAQTIFGKDYAGGKLGSAGASVPLGIFSLSNSPEEVKGIIWEALKLKLFYTVIHVATGN